MREEENSIKIQMSASAFLRYDPVYSWTELSSEEELKVCWASAICQALYLRSVRVNLYMYVYEQRIVQLPPTL